MTVCELSNYSGPLRRKVVTVHELAQLLASGSATC